MKKQAADYENQLAIERDNRRIEAEKANAAQICKTQEESVMKQEQMRRETLQAEMEMRMKTDIAKAEAEARAKANIDRENHDIRMKEIRLEEEVRGKAAGKMWEKSLENLWKLKEDMIGSPEAIVRTAGLAFGLFGAFYVAKYASKTGSDLTTRYFSKPVLVRDTSKKTLVQKLNLIEQVKAAMAARNQAGLEQHLSSKLVVNPRLYEDIIDIAIGAQQSVMHGGGLQNVLLYGPPGTGKTLFARELAKNANMDYAIISGGDMAPLGGTAVTEIHKLFSWAETTKKGMILFIDEADAFLQQRSDAHGKMSEDMRACINAFLRQCERSNLRDFLQDFGP